MTIEIRFQTRLTPCGCTVTLTTPVRKQTKRYRNGYGCAEIRASRWIDEQIRVYREMEKERESEGLTGHMVFFVNGEQVTPP